MPDVDDILRIAQVADPDARVWFGDHTLPLVELGIHVLGTPLGHWSCVQAQLRSKAASHRVLLERIPAIQDLQSAWLLLLFCASPRANYFLRVVHPISSQAFVNEHDQDICLAKSQDLTIGRWPASLSVLVASVCAARRAQHQLLFGPVGQTAWACSVNDTGCRCFYCRGGHRSSHTCSPFARGSRQQRIPSFSGFETAEWAMLADGLRPRLPAFHDIERRVPTHGWQFFAAKAVEEHFVSSSIVPRLSPTESALSRSSGPMAGLPSSVVPSSSFARFCPQLFCVLLLRHSWLPLSLSSRTCWCGRPLDISGHHRAACATLGVLGRRSFGECGSRVCREGGGRVATNLFLRDLDVPCQSHSPTVAAWKWCAMGCLCSGAPSWHWTPRWCLPCVPTGNPGGAVLWRMGQLCRVHVDGRLARTRNCVVHTVALAWLFSSPRPEAVGHSFLSQLAKGGQFSTSCVVALAMLGNTSGRRCSLVWLPVHFALSLLDHRPACGSDGATPSCGFCASS